MPSILRSLTKKIFIIITLVTTLLFLLACAAWFIPPGKYWYVALLGVGFSLLLLCVICLLLFWLAFRSRWFAVPLVALLIGWKPTQAFFAFHPAAAASGKKIPGSIRLMQWNVSRFDEMSKWPRTRETKRKAILAYIGKQDPDIVCMQEFFESNNRKDFDSNIGYLRDTLGYKYYHYTMDYRTKDKSYAHGIAIFSRFPVRDTFSAKFNGAAQVRGNESYIYADIEVQGKIIRVFTTHLQSLLFNRHDYEILAEIKQGENDGIKKSRNIFRKFRMAYTSRQNQADMLRKILDESPYPEIICGDFNDVPNSYAYYRVKGDRKDAYTRKGFGIGRSFYSISPTLRIDYIMTDRQFTILKCQNPHPKLSDHFPVISDMVLENQ